MCASPNYCPNLSATDIGAKNPIWNFDKGVPLFVSIPYQGFLRLKVSVNCNKLKTHSPVWCRNLEVSEPSGSFPVLNQTCQNLLFFSEKNWIWANLLKTHRGPAPWSVQHPLKMAIPYHHPPWSSVGVSTCAKWHPELLDINEAPFICCIYKMTKNFVAFDLPKVSIPPVTLVT